jgi:hypothetical protein
MDMLHLVDRLENLIAGGQRIPLLSQVIVKESELLTLLGQMRTIIVEEEKQSEEERHKRDRLLAQARSEAATILVHAREEAERSLNQVLAQAPEERAYEMLRRATEEAQLIIRRAEEHVLQLRREADHYMAETLRTLRDQLMEIETGVGRTILSIEKGLESLTSEPMEPEEIDEELIAGEIIADGFASLGTVAVPVDHLQAGLQPRRSSLAADTMGY